MNTKGPSLRIKSKDFPTLVEKITRDYYSTLAPETIGFFTKFHNLLAR
jgi:hypothetical protein